jgi:hypothetical protein
MLQIRITFASGFQRLQFVSQLYQLLITHSFPINYLNCSNGYTAWFIIFRQRPAASSIGILPPTSSLSLASLLPVFLSVCHPVFVIIECTMPRLLIQAVGVPCKSLDFLSPIFDCFMLFLPLSPDFLSWNTFLILASTLSALALQCCFLDSSMAMTVVRLLLLLLRLDSRMFLTLFRPLLLLVAVELLDL